MLELQDMDPKILDGKKLALVHLEKLKKEVKKLGIKPKIVSILVGDDPSSSLYTKIKEKKASLVGIGFESRIFPITARFDVVIRFIEQLNQDNNVTGIMVQLPLPKEFLGDFSAREILDAISPKKDVDGLSTNRLVLPATVKGIMSLLEESSIGRSAFGRGKVEINGKNVVVIGTSEEVGKPAALEFAKLGAKVTSCNTKTVNLREKTLQADILVSAAGVPNLIKGNMVKEGVVVIDVGASSKGRSASGREIIVGDVDFNSVYPKAAKITPVPGGVGPMTVVSLLENSVKLVHGHF